MEEFRRSYSRLCKESGAEPQESVLQRLHELPRGRLDLATQSLTVDTCRALGKLLQSEALLTELVLSDCMLSEEGGHPGPAGGRVSPAPQSGVGLSPSRWPPLALSAPMLHCCPGAGPPTSADNTIPPLWEVRPLPLCLKQAIGSLLKPRNRGQFLFVTERPGLGELHCAGGRRPEMGHMG